MALRLDFAATKRRFDILVLTSNMFVNKHSYFPALGVLTSDDDICKFVVFSVTPYGVHSIEASRISLRFC